MVLRTITLLLIFLTACNQKPHPYTILNQYGTEENPFEGEWARKDSVKKRIVTSTDPDTKFISFRLFRDNSLIFEHDTFYFDGTKAWFMKEPKASEIRQVEISYRTDRLRILGTENMDILTVGAVYYRQ